MSKTAVKEAAAEGLGAAVKRGLEGLATTTGWPSETQQVVRSQRLDRLHGAVETMDLFSQDGFSKIAGIAGISISALEGGDYSEASLVAALKAISGIAIDMENCINGEAEKVGCNHQEGKPLQSPAVQADIRRLDAAEAAEAPTGRQPLTLGDFETDPHRNPLIDSDPSETASNIHNALQYMHSADAHIAQSSVLGETTEDGRFRLMDCIEWATRALAADLGKIQVVESK